jgi:glutamate-1-semialdehyde 2,1-aminomutase
MTELLTLGAMGATGMLGLWLAPKAMRRAQLSLAKQPGLAGHSRMASRLARWLPAYAFDETAFFAADGAPDAVQQRRRAGLDRLAALLNARHALTLERTAALRPMVSDLQFTGRYRVPFPFSAYLRSRLSVGAFVERAEGHELFDLVDEVSFHMSGTEAVMQAVRLARYHTGRTPSGALLRRLPRLVGRRAARHRQPAAAARDLHAADMDERSLKVLRSRKDIACVLVNPLQALHPNSGAPGDSSLVDSGARGRRFDRAAYTAWLQRCARCARARHRADLRRGVRRLPSGAGRRAGILRRAADMVTYGKTLGGGLPVGVVCGTPI